VKREILGRLMGWAFLFLFGAIIWEGSSFSRMAQAEEVKKSFKIGLAVLKDNQDYYNARTAFINFFEKESGIIYEFKTLDANGDMEAYKKGLEEFVNAGKVDLIFVTGTRSAGPAAEIIKEIPIVFTAVAFPEKSGLVKDLEHPGGNITGTHCTVPAYPQVKAIMKVIPNVKTIGIVYTEGEPNAEFQTQDFKKAAEQLGLKVLTATVTKECKTNAEVAEATNKLVGKVDVLVAHQDTSISRYGKGMIDVAIANNIPTYVTLGQLLSEGAMFSLGIDFAALGTLSGEQALKILKQNIKPGDIPIETDNNYSLTINISAAKKIGVVIPVQVLKSASKLVK